MNVVLLISETTLKQYTVISDNVDASYIAPSIQKAQDMGLQPLIGSVLYNKLCNDVRNGSIASKYRTLLDNYIVPYLCNQVAVELQWALFAKIRNNGIVTSQDNQTQQMSIGDCEYLRKKYEYDADFYAHRLTDYLCANAANYPEYKKCVQGGIKADADAYKTAIVL